MKGLTISIFFLAGICTAYPQCTISGSGTIDWDDATCTETGSAPVSGDQIIVPSSVTLEFTTNTPNPKHTGDFVIYGKVEINKNDVRLNGDIRVMSGGHLEISEKLRIGPDVADCGYGLAVESGGLVDFPGSGSDDKLFICGSEIARAGGGGCNAYPAGPPPYCEPSGGFTGPTGFDEDGYNPALPVVLLSFTAATADNAVSLKWSTVSEENFDRFIVQRSSDGLHYQDIAHVPGQRRNIYNLESKYSFEDIAPVLGYNYYRLKAIDLDGTYEYFGIRSVRLEGKKTLNVYPNPGRADAITFSTNFNPGEGDRVRLLNTFGKELFQIPLSGKANNFRLSNDIAPGVYFLRYEGTSFKKTVRVFIQN